jgi:predicted TIM-barrel fold metal-dependent hydrolase
VGEPQDVGHLVRHEIGVERIGWSTDFPHVQCDWPRSRQVIEDQFRDIPEDETPRIVGGNAVAFFHLAPG